MIGLPVLAFLISFGILIVLMSLLHLAPFGGSANSWASMDADIQYLDFFAYLKDVLEGKQSVAYSFSNLLGQSGVALFSYYLSSPVNLLLIFFDKAHLNAFFDIAVAVKISLCALTMAVYLRIRFKGEASALFTLMLSLCYAFMQYNIAQSSNIMWLDGVYMLPLIMVGVYFAVSKSKFAFLSVTVGLSIIFNWYSGAINCIFSVIWFFFEYLLCVQGKKCKGRIFIRSAVTYIISMCLGVMLSAVLFWPNVVALREGKGGTFDWSILKNEFVGNPISALRRYSLGGTSEYGAVSLFCGSLVLVGCAGVLVTRTYKMKHKLIFGGLLFICFMMFYWKPACFVFSLFKSVESYWYRYGYTGSFALVVLAAWFYFAYHFDGSYTLLKAVFLYALLFLVLDYIKPLKSEKIAVVTVLFTVITVLLVYAVYFYQNKNIKLYYLTGAAVSIVLMMELFVNASLVTKTYWKTNVQSFEKYESAETDLADMVKSQDTGNYRISQNMTRRMSGFDITANYNESMAYDYKSIEGYASSLQYAQVNFLDHLGYRAEGAHIIVVKNTSVLSADALLGVKYTFSPYPVKGLQKQKKFGTVNKKEVYVNPYSMPIVFSIDASGTFSTDAENPFTYQNALYSYLLGRNVELFVPAEFERQDDGSDRIYSISVPTGNYALYGNLPWRESMKTTLNLNNTYSIPYSRWLSQSVFYIPMSEGDSMAQVSLSSDKLNAITDEQFYLLDLDVLKDVTDELKSGNTVSDLKIENGHVSCKVKASAGQKLFTSVPYEKGWTVRVDGKTVIPETIDDCLMVVPLEKGNNRIELSYMVPGLRTGIAISCTGLILIILGEIIARIREHKKIR